MKNKYSYFLMLFFVLLSCNNNEARIAENIKEAKKKEAVFANISKAWIFNAQPTNPASVSLMGSWTAWRIFLDELSRKPKSTIGAFQQKAKNLSKKALDLNKNIPAPYDSQAIKSRVTVLITKINSLNLYINLTQIPEKKVIGLVLEINTELDSLQSQMDEIVRKSKIKSEDGESDLIKMRDTTRAIPNNPKMNTLPK